MAQDRFRYSNFEFALAYNGGFVEKLFLTVACGDYDRTKPLQDGSVEPEGIRLNYVPMLPYN